MGIEIGQRYPIGSEKYIEPIGVNMEMASGNKYYQCVIHRADGRTTTGIYHTYHIQALIERWSKKQADDTGK